jgi:protein arginine kinase
MKEDHLRLQALRSGFAVPQAFEDVQLDWIKGQIAQVPYAFPAEFRFSVGGNPDGQAPGSGHRC